MFAGDDDPFGFGMFRHMHRQMHEMDRMMESMMDPFGLRFPPPHMMLEQPASRRPRYPPPHEELISGPPMPFGPFGLGLGGIFNTMNQLQNRAMNDPNSHVFSSSTMMTFDEHGRPRVVQETSRKSGDVREDRRLIRDHDIEEVEIGHTIGNRSHYIEKKRDREGKVKRQERFVNLDEGLAQDFDREFQSRARTNMFGNRYDRDRAIGDGSGFSNRRAERSTRDSSAPIITLPEEDEASFDNRSSSSYGGPIIREISEEEAQRSIPKRRREHFGRFRVGED